MRRKLTKVVRKFNELEAHIYFKSYGHVILLNFIPEIGGNGFLPMLKVMTRINQMHIYHDARLCLLFVDKISKDRFEKIIFCLKAEDNNHGKKLDF